MIANQVSILSVEKDWRRPPQLYLIAKLVPDTLGGLLRFDNLNLGPTFRALTNLTAQTILGPYSAPTALAFDTNHSGTSSHPTSSAKTAADGPPPKSHSSTACMVAKTP